MSTTEFDDFYRTHRASAVRWATALVGSPEVGEEIAQEALAAVGHRLPTLTNPAGYLRQWAGRVLIDTQEGERAAGQAANAFGATGWPFWVAVGADGTVTQRTAGELDKTALQALVAASTTPKT